MISEPGMCVASIALAFLVFVVCICCFDVPCPRLGRDLGVALGDVVAIAEKFCDKGRHYMSAIFAVDDRQRALAEASKEALERSGKLSIRVVTRILQASTFYPAEDYHKDFLKRNPNNPYIAMNDLPKLDELKLHFPDLYRNY